MHPYPAKVIFKGSGLSLTSREEGRDACSELAVTVLEMVSPGPLAFCFLGDEVTSPAFLLPDMSFL